MKTKNASILARILQPGGQEPQKYLQVIRKMELFSLGITTKSILRSENAEGDNASWQRKQLSRCDCHQTCVLRNIIPPIHSSRVQANKADQCNQRKHREDIDSAIRQRPLRARKHRRNKTNGEKGSMVQDNQQQSVQVRSCAPTGEGLQLQKDMHEGVCVSDNDRRALVRKVFMKQFYWPTFNNEFVKRRGRSICLSKGDSLLVAVDISRRTCCSVLSKSCIRGDTGLFGEIGCLVQYLHTDLLCHHVPPLLTTPQIRSILDQLLSCWSCNSWCIPCS